MKLTDILAESSIVADLRAHNKTEALKVLVEAVAKTNPEIEQPAI
jgi:hypothetical protein